MASTDPLPYVPANPPVTERTGELSRATWDELYRIAERIGAIPNTGPVLILNTLPDTAPPAGYVPAPLLWGATPLNPLGMYAPATGDITIKEAGLYAFRGTFRCNHPGGGGANEVEVGVNMSAVSGTPVGLNEFRPLIVNWDVSETLFVPFSATYRCKVNDTFRFNAFSATGGIVSVGGGNAGNSQMLVTRLA